MNVSSKVIINTLTVVNGDVNYLAGTILNFSCPTGYGIDNLDLTKVECTALGSWNSTFPTCLKGKFNLTMVVFRST